MHVHIAWQIYHHQQKVKVSLAFLALGRGAHLRACDLPIEEALKQILKSHRQAGRQAGRVRYLLEKLFGNLAVN